MPKAQALAAVEEQNTAYFFVRTNCLITNN